MCGTLASRAPLALLRLLEQRELGFAVPTLGAPWLRYPRCPTGSIWKEPLGARWPALDEAPGTCPLDRRTSY